MKKADILLIIALILFLAPLPFMYLETNKKNE